MPEQPARPEHHAGQRLSLKGSTCTVRYVGTVDGKPGEWLGVEWDRTLRGKHNGVHEGKKYFECQSQSLKCASFIRLPASLDKTRTFIEALREKYMSSPDTAEQEAIYFSSKQAEEVGFAKFAARQAQLRGIYVLVLEGLCIRHSPTDPEVESIEHICADITDLTISGNLFETFGEVYDLVRRFPRLRSLSLDGNRFSISDILSFPEGSLSQIRTLTVSNTLLDWNTEVTPLIQRHFPGLQTLTATDNECTTASVGVLPTSLKTLHLSNNEFTSLASLSCVTGSRVEALVLKNCAILQVRFQPSQPLFHSVTELDVRSNNVTDWSFFDTLPSSFPSLRHLRTTGNPLYANLKMPDGKKSLGEDEGYMLTIARLPQVDHLNYSKITEKERLNAEMFYLNTIIAAELSACASDAESNAVKQRHPRWASLVEEYGEPIIARKQTLSAGEVDLNSLAARLVTVTFISGTKEWMKEVPKSFSVYEVLGIVGKKLGIMPLRVRLVFESGEQDPIGAVTEYRRPEEWESDDSGEEEDVAVSAFEEGRPVAENGDQQWVPRRVELVAGTRALGTYVEGREAKIHIERKTTSV